MTEKQREKMEAMMRVCRDKMRVKGMALSTEDSYLWHIRSYIEFLAEHGREVADVKGRIEAFLTRMAHGGCAAATQNQALNALKFLYEVGRGEKLPEGIDALRARRPVHHRTALSEEQTLALLAAVPDVAGYPTRLVAWWLYGSGLRVSEPLNLRIKDVDLPNRRAMIRGAKGGKDRTVTIPDCLVPLIETQMKAARAVWEGDARMGMPVELPGALARKYPRAPLAWQWAWLFPAHKPCEHPRSGERVRWRLHEANVQKAVRFAARKLDLDGLATPHVLRHCWATHQLRAGQNIKAIQDALGHKHLETTMVYLHTEGQKMPSPLDRVPSNVVPFAPVPPVGEAMRRRA